MSMLAFQRYQIEFCAHTRAPRCQPKPKGVPAKRIGIYAELLFNNLESTLSSCFPVSRKVLGVRRWQTLVRNFLAHYRCATPLFRQIPEEFLLWLQQGASAELPPYLPQLAHYEWVELALAVSDAVAPEGIHTAGDLLEGVPVLAPALMLLRYDWPVQHISPRRKPTQPLNEPVFLLVFRDVSDEVRFIELNPITARLVELLQLGSRTGYVVLTQISAELAHSEPERIVAFGADILANLREQGAILGTLLVSNS